MSLEQTTELYASVLHQLLPEGLHDSAQTTLVADDIYAHAKVLAQADIDAHRLLKVLEEVPPELLPEYEAEYGLPLKCSINAGRTIEERIEILRWVRSARNVLNRTYLEQILAIFGVVLIDIVKFKPLLCTAPCNSPVNTEQLRYKVFLRLQYPMNADMSCIVENYLPGYLRIGWMIDMPWGDWIVNSGVTVNTNGIAHYTAYKTNQRDYYDSFANLDLTDAIIRSFHDADMQQWQGFKDAIGSNSFTWDGGFHISFTKVRYKGYGYIKPASSINWSNPAIFYVDTFDYGLFQNTAIQQFGQTSWDHMRIKYAGPPNPNQQNEVYVLTNGYNQISLKVVEETIQVTMTFVEIAQKIISNLQSSNEGTSLLAEAYLEAVANSIFNPDESKQFLKLSDLLSQFELNKTLRT